MDEFAVVQTLRGAIYGQVALVRHRATDAVYAMKLMSLAHMSAQRAVSGPVVREDGNTELRVLRRVSGNRVMVGGFGREVSDPDTSSRDVERSSWSVHPLWEAWGVSHGGLLDHHNLLVLHTDFVDDRANARCLVFDYCPYGELYDQLQRTPTKTLGVETARVVFMQLATAVRYIHAQNIAHRDVTLENVLMDGNRECRLGDFGLACEYGTMCSGRVGKPFYMAPEVYGWQPGELYNGLKADMWSLGIVLFILVTGAPPFETPSEADARFRVVQSSGVHDLLSIWKLDAKLPHKLCDLLCALLCVDTEERVDIEDVWAHPWMQDAVDAEVLAAEGQFWDRMVGVRHQQPEGDGASFTHEDDNNDDDEQCEPQEEVEAEAASASNELIQKRRRKRIKITIEDTMGGGGGGGGGMTSTGRVAGFFGGPIFDGEYPSSLGPPPQLRHETPSGEISPDGPGRSVQPRTSPVVWPKIGVKAALRSLFSPAKLSSDTYPGEEIRAVSTEPEEKEAREAGDVQSSGLPRRRPRLDSSSSCSSSSSASSSCLAQLPAVATNPTLGDDVVAGASRPPGVLLCRFCLQWVDAANCANRVTLPSQAGAQATPDDASGRSKTRRVCDSCFVSISAALVRRRRRSSSIDSGGDPLWGCGTTAHHTPQVA